MMGCVPTQLQVALAQPSLELQEAVGIRSALERVNYVGIVSSEPTHTIRTPYLAESDGRQLLPRTMLDTWIQGEDDNGVWPQCQVMEFICQPQQQGFQKRTSMVYG